MSETHNDQSMNEQSEVEIRKPLQFIFPESVQTRFANYTLVQHDADSFVLSFFEVQNPPFIGSKAEVKKQVEGLEALPAVCVARIVVTPSHFKRVVGAVQVNLAKYEKSQQGMDAEKISG